MIPKYLYLSFLIHHLVAALPARHACIYFFKKRSTSEAYNPGEQCQNMSN